MRSAGRRPSRGGRRGRVAYLLPIMSVSYVGSKVSVVARWIGEKVVASSEYSNASWTVEGVSEGKAQAGPGRMVDVPPCESCGQCAFGMGAQAMVRCRCSLVELLVGRCVGSGQASSDLEGGMEGGWPAGVGSRWS